MTRIASGLALAALALALILLGSAAHFLAALEAVAVVCLLEFYGLLRAGGRPLLELAGTAVGAGLLFVFYMEDPFAITAFAGAAFVLVFTTAAGVHKKNALPAAAFTMFGAVYVSVTLGALALIRKAPEGATLVITLIAANALADVFAYYTGRLFGKTPLAPSISPGKTWEGLFGGIIGAAACAVALKALIAPFLSLTDAAALGAIAGIIGPAGDLAESAIKRSVGVKDSGRIIPGHGGALDRLDSLMFSSVFFFIYMRLFIQP